MYNLLIVEDEKYTRDYISNYIKRNFGEFFCIYSVENAKKAVEVLENTHIDVVFTDIMMSGMNGIELAELISKKFKEIIVIIISGYEEFEYAKKAIKYKVREYLLKPLELDELSQQLINIKEELDNKNENNVFNHMGTLYEARECFFVNIAHGGASALKNEIEKSKILSFPFDIENTPCDIVAVRIEEYDNFLKEKWCYDKESLKNAMNNLMAGFIGNDCVFCISNDEGYFEYIVYHTGISLNYSEISNKIYILLKMPVKIYKKSETFNNIYELIEYFNKNSSIKEKSLLFMTYLKENNKKEAKHILKSVFESGNIKQLLLELGLSDFVNYNEIESVDQLYDEITTRSDLHQNSISEAIERAKKYIQTNFARNISREEVADVTYLSPSYFASNFKIYTGENFSDYLLRVRMENAIELMKKNKYKVYEIAKKVGYNNVKYFYKVFKAYSGYSPKDYITFILGQTNVND